MPIPASLAKYLIDNMNTAVLLLEETMTLSTMNIACEHLLSVSCRQARGMRLDVFLPNNKGLMDVISKAMTQGSAITEYEVSIHLPSMQSAVVDCTISPIAMPGSGHGLVMELINSNSVNRISRKQNLIQQQTTAKESTRAMAHEIKNPLGGIRGAAQLLARELPDERFQEYTRIIIDEADRLRNLVDRMMTSHKKLTIARVNIHEVIEYVCSLIEAEAKRPFNLVRDYDPSLPELDADRELLIQALLNVVRNSVQAIPEPGEIVIRTRVQYQASIINRTYNLALCITVQDNGPGIPPEIEDSVFFPMITGRAEGSGLGLSIAQSLIQKHGGLIEYHREDDLTHFTLLLPLDNDHEQSI